MARKRGGLAGLYDRNKGVIQAAAPFVAGAIGGPLAGAAVGAAMRGFDRPGQSGIGFDFGQGLSGGIAGYGTGALGANLKNLLTGAMARRAASQGLAAGTSALEGANFSGLDLPGVSLERPILEGMGGGGFDASSYLAANAAQGASAPMQLGRGVSTVNPTAMRQMAAQRTAAAAPSAMTNQFPSMEQIGRTSYASAPSPLAQQPGAAGRFSNLQDINQNIPGPRRAAAPTAPRRGAELPTNQNPGAWWKSKEAMEAFSRGGQTAATLMGQQSAAAQAQREYDEQQRQLQARAQLMALFAPRILASYEPRTYRGF